jgi:hypothetical protein
LWECKEPLLYKRQKDLIKDLKAKKESAGGKTKMIHVLLGVTIKMPQRDDSEEDTRGGEGTSGITGPVCLRCGENNALL